MSFFFNLANFTGFLYYEAKQQASLTVRAEKERELHYRYIVKSQ